MLQHCPRSWFVTIAASAFIFSSFPSSAKPDTSVSAAVTERDKHTVRPGETLWSISRLHGVSIGELMDLNNLKSASIREGQVLKIPRTERDIALAPTKPTSYTVSKGETFRSIARKHGITQTELEKANPKVDPDIPKVGTKLVIPHIEPDAEDTKKDADKSKDSSSVVKIKIGEKDTIYSLAKKHGTTEKALLAANPGVRPDRLRPGSTLNLPVKKSPASASTGKSKNDASNGDGAAKPAQPSSTRSRPYSVSQGESAPEIAEAFGISVKKLYEMNGLKPGTSLKVGQEIRVPARSAGAD